MIITVAGLAGAGKTTLCEKIVGGFPDAVHIDLDEINTKLLKRAEVKSFGYAIFDDKVFKDDQLVKPRIAELIYNDKMLYDNWCEFMRAKCQQHVEAMILKKPERLYIIEHVLIDKLSFFKKSVYNILVELDKNTRLERVMKRDNLTKEQAENRERFLTPYENNRFHLVYKEDAGVDIVNRINDVLI